MIDFSLSSKIKAIGANQNTIYIFKNKNFGKNAPEHFHISIPISVQECLLLVFTTSKVEEKKTFYKSNPKALSSLIDLSVSDLKFITKDCLIDCNNPLYYSKEELETLILDGEIIFKEDEISNDLIKDIKNKIKSSPLVKPFIKKKILP